MRARAAATVGSSARAKGGDDETSEQQGKYGDFPGGHDAISKTRHKAGWKAGATQGRLLV